MRTGSLARPVAACSTSPFFSVRRRRHDEARRRRRRLHHRLCCRLAGAGRQSDLEALPEEAGPRERRAKIRAEGLQGGQAVLEGRRFPAVRHGRRRPLRVPHQGQVSRPTQRPWRGPRCVHRRCQARHAFWDHGLALWAHNGLSLLPLLRTARRVQRALFLHFQGVYDGSPVRHAVTCVGSVSRDKYVLMRDIRQ